MALIFSNSNRKYSMKNLLNDVIESIPLSFFLLYIQCIDIKQSHDWLLPYLMASVAALGSMVYLARRGVILNRLSVGINLYFLSGLFGLVFEWLWLNQLYGQVRGLGMLGWIVALGIVTSLFSCHGFIGLANADRASLAQGSLLLLLASILALIMAGYFIDNRFWGEWFPFIFLFLTRSALQQLSRASLSATHVMGKIFNKITG